VVAEELARLLAVQSDLERKLGQTTRSDQGTAGATGRQAGGGAGAGQADRQIGEQLGAAREHRCGLASRQKLLEDLEARREGVSEGVQSVLRQRKENFPFVRGLVADVLRVDIEHAL
jgi:chromosome segregation ATPase